MKRKRKEKGKKKDYSNHRAENQMPQEPKPTIKQTFRKNALC